MGSLRILTPGDISSLMVQGLQEILCSAWFSSMLVFLTRSCLLPLTVPFISLVQDALVLVSYLYTVSEHMQCK